MMSSYVSTSRLFSLTLVLSIAFAVIAYLVLPSLEAINQSGFETFIMGLVAAQLAQLIVIGINRMAGQRSDEDDDGNYSNERASASGLTTIYVGNLAYRANERDLRELFGEHGRVQSVRIMKDRQTGKKRGFGFIEMTEQEANQAIRALNGNEFHGRELKVNVAENKRD